MDEVEQAHPHRGGVLWAEAVEEVYVHAATDDSALRSDEQAAWGCGRELVDRVGELAHQLLVEQVQRRAVDAHDCQRAVVVESDEAHLVGSMCGESLQVSVRAGDCAPESGSQRGANPRGRSVRMFLTPLYWRIAKCL